MNCIVNPFRHDGKEFYNAAEFILESISSQFEIEDGGLSDAPLAVQDDEFEFFLGGYDSAGNGIAIKYN